MIVVSDRLLTNMSDGPVVCGWDGLRLLSRRLATYTCCVVGHLRTLDPSKSIDVRYEVLTSIVVGARLPPRWYLVVINDRSTSSYLVVIRPY